MILNLEFPKTPQAAKRLVLFADAFPDQLTLPQEIVELANQTNINSDESDWGNQLTQGLIDHNGSVILGVNNLHMDIIAPPIIQYIESYDQSPTLVITNRQNLEISTHHIRKATTKKVFCLNKTEYKEIPDGSEIVVTHIKMVPQLIQHGHYFKFGINVLFGLDLLKEVHLPNVERVMYILQYKPGFWNRIFNLRSTSNTVSDFQLLDSSNPAIRKFLGVYNGPQTNLS